MPSLNRRSPTGHIFGRPPLLAAENSIALHSFTGSQTFQPAPPATDAYPYRLDLADIIGADQVGDHVIWLRRVHVSHMPCEH